MNDRIEHAGVVCGVEAGCVRVRIQQTSACAHCKVAGTCLSSRDTKAKIVEVFTTNEYKVGDAVRVSASASMAASALLYAFGLPFVAVVAVLAAVVAATGDEALAGVCGIASLVPYYTLLYMCRGKLRRAMRFEICGSI